MLDLPSHFLKGLSVVRWYLNDIRTPELLGPSDVGTDKPLIYLSFFHPKKLNVVSSLNEG